ncbi:MAG: (d)CMP kinase [Phycisphaerales bacterium]
MSSTPSVNNPSDGSAGRGGRAGRALIVTIDGPAGTGKSTVARDLARRLGLDFLDTGAMYRAATAIALDLGIPLDDAETIAEMVRRANLTFDWSEDPPELHAFGKSIMHRLRADDVDAGVSPVASLAGVRRVLVEVQKRIGSEHPRLVTEGRDQGSVVFPDAEVKVFLFASARVRAERRAAQLGVASDSESVERIHQELLERDRRDSTRPTSPLIRPEGAVELDTSTLDRDAVVGELVRIVRSVVPDVRVAGSGMGLGAGRREDR